ncbi:hypothetical protein [Larkinella punicea]|uniref:Uncharacterized protein n=1 Tax=Larkinella punicea TaxID=2315727 RepID=A0A368JUC4_9BACT|nr:hypothetical protein [Larkinella punicea]RCR71257.1 hypothetical protein DUE52_03135 [Larkinella punicea]
MITIIDSFIYSKPDSRADLDIGKTLNKTYQEDMRKMEGLVRMLNQQSLSIRLTFHGNSKEGLKIAVDCPDEALKGRITKVLRQFLDEQSDL